MPEPATAAEQRIERRSNLFVIAALHWRPGVPAPVRIRNLSPRGALIEGPGLPAAGTSVRLSRGGLCADGQLMWRDDVHAGVCFADAVRVADWLPREMRNAAQQRVDETLYEVRAAPSASPGVATLVQAAPDYAAISRSLLEAGEELVADPAIAGRHAGALQAIAIAVHALARLAENQ